MITTVLQVPSYQSSIDAYPVSHDASVLLSVSENEAPRLTIKLTRVEALQLASDIQFAIDYMDGKGVEI